MAEPLLVIFVQNREQFLREQDYLEYNYSYTKGTKSYTLLSPTMIADNINKRHNTILFYGVSSFKRSFIKWLIPGLRNKTIRSAITNGVDFDKELDEASNILLVSLTGDYYGAHQFNARLQLYNNIKWLLSMGLTILTRGRYVNKNISFYSTFIS